MKTTRNRYSSDFKAKIALDAIRGEMTLSELGPKHGIHPTVIGGWKRQAMEGLAGLFDAGEPAAKTLASQLSKKKGGRTADILLKPATRATLMISGLSNLPR